MALTSAAKTFKLMELTDVKLRTLGAGDVPSNTSIDLPGALKLTISPTIDTKKLYGDSELKDVYSKVQEIEVKGESSLFSLDALAVLVGGNASAIGTGATAGARTYTVATNAVANDTLTVEGVTLTATASTTDATHFAVGASASATATNIVTALQANTTISALYTVSGGTATFTLTEKNAGAGKTPAVATFTGTLSVTSGSATTSVSPTTVTSFLYSMTAANTTPPYFFIEGKWNYVNSEAGDAHVKLYKVKCTSAPSFEINDASNDFGSVSFTALALPTTDASNIGQWFDLKINESATEIS